MYIELTLLAQEKKKYIHCRLQTPMNRELVLRALIPPLFYFFNYNYFEYFI